jgi:hypothetical protein
VFGNIGWLELHAEAVGIFACGFRMPVQIASHQIFTFFFFLTDSLSATRSIWVADRMIGDK